MDASERERALSKRWMWGGLLAAVALLVVGIVHSPPVISVHSGAGGHSATSEAPKTPPQPEENEQQRRPSLAPLLFFVHP